MLQKWKRFSYKLSIVFLPVLQPVLVQIFNAFNHERSSEILLFQLSTVSS